MKIARVALIALFVAAVPVMAQQQSTVEIETLVEGAQAVDFPGAADGMALVLADGASVQLTIPLGAGLYRVSITAMAIGDEAAAIESLMAEATGGRHYVPAGQWGTIGLALASGTVGPQAQVRLTARGAEVALDRVTVERLEESRESLPLVAPGTLHRETPLIADGQPAATLLLPRAPEYRAVAEEFGRRFAEHTGVTLPVLDEDGASAQELAAGTAIMVGNLASGPLSLRLYARRLIYADGAFPGAGGHELRTVHDAWGPGANVVYLGGSDPEGCRAAGEALLGRIERAPTITLPVTIDWVSEATNFGPVSDERIAQEADELAAYLRSFSGMSQYQSGSNRPSAHAQAYYLGGGDTHAKAYAALVRVLFDYYQEAHPDPPTFALEGMVAALDQVEECPAMTDEDRLMAAEWVRRVVDDSMKFWEMREPIARERDGVRGPTWNHQTHPSVGIAFAVEYFSAHHTIPQVDWWRRVVDNLFLGQERVYKPLEDSANYQWITIDHTATWALARGQMTLFESDTLRRTCELALACHDNFGDEATFGDAWMAFGSNARALLRMGALYYDEPRFRWLAQRLDAKARSAAVPAYFNWRGAVEEPTDQIGLTSFILDPAVYASYLEDNAAVGAVPPERALDKAVFRSGFGEQDSYLMLDGISMGVHDHDDANAIIRFTANGRLWLCDMDYIRATAKWHNSIMLSRDGETTPIPPLAELVAEADFGAAGMAQARAPGYAGADWTRSIFWADDSFVVFDELTAREPGDFRATAVWRTLGEAQIAGNRLDVEQQGERFHIENADGARLSLRETWDRGHGGDRGYYANYPFAGRMTQVLHQDQQATLAAGESIRFVNLFQADQQAEPALTLRTVAPGVVALFRGAEFEALVGVGSWQRGEARIEAAMFVLTGQTARFADLRQVDLPGLQRTAAGDDVEAGAPAALGTWLEALAAEAQRPPAPAELVRPELPRELAVAWRADLGSPVTCSDLWGLSLPARIAAGTEDGRTVLLDADGQVAWERPAEAMVRAVRLIDITGDGEPELLSGADDAKLRAYSGDGELLWEVAIQPYHGRSGSVASICAAQLDDDPPSEVVIGSDNWHHYGFDGDGRELWRTDTTHACTVCAAGDMDGDGLDEIAAGSEYYGSSVIDHTGRRVGSVSGGPNWPAVAVLDLDLDGDAEVLFGADDGVVRAQGPGNAKLWQANVGGAPTGIVGLMPNASGAVVAISSESGSVYGHDAAGARRWRTELPEQVAGLATLNDALAAACDDGAVYLLGADGAILGGYRQAGRPRGLTVGDLRGAGAAAIIAAWGGELVALRVD